eukprot:203737_1
MRHDRNMILDRPMDAMIHFNSPVLVWLAILAITFEVSLYVLLLTLKQEIDISLFVQIALIFIVMISCVVDGVCHMVLFYYNKRQPDKFDAFLGTPAFCLDCVIMAACLVLSPTSSQKYVLRIFGVDVSTLTSYYRFMQTLGQPRHIS